MAIFADNNDHMNTYTQDDTSDALSSCPPLDASRRKTILVPLKTVLENRAGNVTIEVHVVEIPLRSANDVLNAFKERFGPGLGDFQHLRRFARRHDLPTSITSRFDQIASSSSRLIDDTAGLYLLVGPLDTSHVDELRECLAAVLPGEVASHAFFHMASVPLLAPTSQEQADAWSATHWPTIYKKSNPFGPHPSIVARAEAEIAKDVATMMKTAAIAGQDAAAQALGEAVGAVVVDRSSGAPQILAVAADARWSDTRCIDFENVMGHAALRAIGMVARRLSSPKRVSDIDHGSIPPGVSTMFESVFLDAPLVEVENHYLATADFFRCGYLCHGLEIYMTHEPCVMCSMAILHSRFVRVVFGHRMSGTGGLCSEARLPALANGHGVKGHGLFWREELNWSMLAWQYDMGSDASAVTADTEI